MMMLMMEVMMMMLMMEGNDIELVGLGGQKFLRNFLETSAAPLGWGYSFFSMPQLFSEVPPQFSSCFHLFLSSPTISDLGGNYQFYPMRTRRKK